MRAIDLTGCRFNRLTVIRKEGKRRDVSGNSRIYWRCQCDCGSEVVLRAGAITSGNTQSCGCLQQDVIGKHNPNWKGGRWITEFGYVAILTPGHHRTSARGYVMEHVLVAEAALGKPLHRKHPVHHLNENRADNRNVNLVICESQKYHLLLHARQRIIKMGGDPDIQKLCFGCKCLLLKVNFSKNKRLFDGFAGYCRECVAIGYRLRTEILLALNGVRDHNANLGGVEKA